MADGTFAVAMIVLGLLDMNTNHCGTEAGCLGRSATTPRLSFAAGEWVERRAKPAGELYIRYDLGTKLGPFGQAVGLSVAENGETWIGYGHTWKHDFSDRVYTELHAMPGLYARGNGFDLGSAIEFRSGIELGIENAAGWRFAVSYDHRSNAGIFGGRNPGVEVVKFRVSIPLK